MPDVFISYARADAYPAGIIADRLASEGFSVIFDRNALVVGQNWSEAIVRDIRSAKAVLALLSSNSRRSNFVAEELQAALEAKAVVIPVLLDRGGKDNWLWPLLATRQSVELNLGTAERELQLDKLVRDLSKALGKEEAAALRAAPYKPYKWIVYAAIVVALIGAGLAWVAFRQTVTRANLSGANLIGANLSGASLRGADLNTANLSGANLIGANLSGANLSGANLIDANLGRANLTGANLDTANLSGANLSVANLIGANLGRANLIGAHLNGANLSGANLSGANLGRADLGGADLRGAGLLGANLSGADLRKARYLTQPQLDEACGDANIQRPEGLTIKPCPTSDQPKIP
jgi:uncharacterized protein YjbI with pentapeptide repeats